MTLPEASPARSIWWPVTKHIALRLLLVVVAYFVSVIATLIGVVVIYSVLSNVEGAPDYFDAFAVSPLIALFVPWIAGIVLLLALIVGAVPTLVTAAITEGFALRQPWLHALLGIAVSGISFAMVTPTLIDGVSNSDIADVGIFATAGIVGGVTYWLIAGRGAGIIPDWMRKA